MRKSPDNANAALGGGGAAEKTSQGNDKHYSYKKFSSQSQGLTALLHYVGRGRYHASFRGERLVEHSKDPECELARAMLELGLHGTVLLCDGSTGVRRSSFDIERLAQYRCTETEGVPRFRRVACAQLPQTGESKHARSVASGERRVAP